MNPKKIIVMRHAESEEDVDKSVYAHTPDLDIALSRVGEMQSILAGTTLYRLIGDGAVHFFVSPGARLRQTYDLMTARFPASLTPSFSIEALLLKQYWGDVTVENRREIEIARYKEGVLVYQFPNGESGGQLIERFQQFIRNLRKEFEKDDFPENIVILTHGFEMRIFLMVWFGWSVARFESLANPRNCEMLVLSKGEDGTYSADREMRCYDAASNPNHIART